MKRYSLLMLAAALLVIAGLACGGGGVETQPPAPTTAPPSNVQPPATGGLDYTLEPNFGVESLAAGFASDPYMVSVTSGGSVDVDGLDLGSDCTGYATSAPDFRIQWSGSSSNLRIFFVADDENEDATLIVNDARGNYYCNDDFSGWNPLVDIPNPAEGQIDIWVGSYSSSDYVAGTLYVTELD